MIAHVFVNRNALMRELQESATTRNTVPLLFSISSNIEIIHPLGAWLLALKISVYLQSKEIQNKTLHDEDLNNNPKQEKKPNSSGVVKNRN